MNVSKATLTLAFTLALTGCGQDEEGYAPCQSGEIYSWRGGEVVCEAMPEGLPGCSDGELLVRREDAWGCEEAPTAELECQAGESLLYTATGTACATPEQLPECDDGASLVARGGELSCTDVLPSCAADQAVAVDVDGARCVDVSRVPQCRAGELPIIHDEALRCARVIVRGGIVDVRRRTLDELVASPLVEHRIGVSRNPMATQAMIERLASGGLSGGLLERDDTSAAALVTLSTFVSHANNQWRTLLSHPNTTDEVWRVLLSRDSDTLFGEVTAHRPVPMPIPLEYMEMALESATMTHRFRVLEFGEWPVARAEELARTLTNEHEFGALAANEGLSESTYTLLVDRVEPGFGEALVKNASLPTHLLDALVARAPYLPQHEIARNPNASVALLEEALAGGQLEAVAANPGASREQRMTLASDPDARVRRALCQNPSLEPDEVDALVLDANDSVVRDCASDAPLSDANVATLSAGYYERRALLDNPSVSSEALIELVAVISSQHVPYMLDHPNTDQSVRDALFDHPMRVGDSDLAEHPETTEGMLEAIWARSNQNRYLARSLADNPNTPPSTLAAIVASDDVFIDWFARELANNPNSPPALLEQLALDVLIVGDVARNPSCQPELLRSIYASWNQRHSGVMSGLCVNLNTPRSVIEELLYSSSHECAAAHPSLEVD